MKDRKRKDGESGGHLSPMLICWGIGILFGALIFVLMIVSIAPERHDLSVGDIAPETIRATKDIEDEINYRRRVDEMIADVPKKTIRNTDAEQQAIQNVRSTLEEIEAIHADFDLIFSDIRGSETFDEDFDRTMASEEQMDRIRERIGLPLSSDLVRDIMRLTSGQLHEFNLALSAQVSSAYNTEFLEGALGERKSVIISYLERNGTKTALIELARGLLDAFFVPNSVFDETQYQIDIAEAEASVEPIIVMKGENIILEGERITEAQYHLLLELGLLSERVDLPTYFGLAAVVALLVLVLGLFLAVFEPEVIKRPRTLLLLCAACLLHMLISVAAMQIHPYLAPLQFGVLFLAILIKPRMALAVNFVLTVMVGIVAGGSNGLLSTVSSNLIIVGLVGGCQAVYLTRKPLQRAGLFLVGLATGLIDMAVLLALGLMTTSNIQEMISASLWSAAGGLLSGMLTIGLMPIFENVFHLLTPPRLLELSNPHQPLLKRLLLEAPGTYHHAIMVANLAEAAVDTVGGNPLLTRVSAYYHDVGKLKRPYYFGENQLGGENPHDRMEPRISSATLTAHTSDGAQLAENARLPEAIIDIIRQHHGDSVTQYFYAKAVKQYGEDQVDIGDYRYIGPKPQSREAAIVMLADVVEAAVRSLKDRSPETVEPFVRRLVRNKLEDGQLDNAPLTLRDLDEIIRAFCKVLAGMYHERVAYPDIEISKHVQRT